MADSATVVAKLEQIEQYYGELREKQDTLSRDAFLKDTTEQRAVERMFENAITACADLARHVAAREYGYEGGESKEAIRQLAEEGVIDGATAETLVAAVGFRNVLAHRYGDIDYSEVYELLQNGLAVYDEFGRQVAAWFKERG